MWIDKNISPTESGYYLTYYYNEEQDAMMIKAFVYSVPQGKWCFRFDPDVKCWWNVRHDYYIPCQMQENVEAIPDDYRENNPSKSCP